MVSSAPQMLDLDNEALFAEMEAAFAIDVEKELESIFSPTLPTEEPDITELNQPREHEIIFAPITPETTERKTPEEKKKQPDPVGGFTTPVTPEQSFETEEENNEEESGPSSEQATPLEYRQPEESREEERTETLDNFLKEELIEQIQIKNTMLALAQQQVNTTLEEVTKLNESLKAKVHELSAELESIPKSKASEPKFVCVSLNDLLKMRDIRGKTEEMVAKLAETRAEEDILRKLLKQATDKLEAKDAELEECRDENRRLDASQHGHHGGDPLAEFRRSINDDLRRSFKWVGDQMDPPASAPSPCKDVEPNQDSDAPTTTSLLDACPPCAEDHDNSTSSTPVDYIAASNKPTSVPLPFGNLFGPKKSFSNSDKIPEEDQRNQTVSDATTDGAKAETTLFEVTL
jgi:hypothetical protein